MRAPFLSCRFRVGLTTQPQPGRSGYLASGSAPPTPARAAVSTKNNHLRSQRTPNTSEHRTRSEAEFLEAPRSGYTRTNLERFPRTRLPTGIRTRVRHPRSQIPQDNYTRPDVLPSPSRITSQVVRNGGGHARAFARRVHMGSASKPGQAAK